MAAPADDELSRELPVAESIADPRVPLMSDDAELPIAEVWNESQSDSGTGDVEVIEAEWIELVAAPVQISTNVPPKVRQGSPFAGEASIDSAVTSLFASLPAVRREERYTARGGATAALAIGVWGCLTCWIPTSSTAVGMVVVVAMLGVLLGLWGRLSIFTRRATWGIGLCSASIGLTLLIGTLSW